MSDSSDPQQPDLMDVVEQYVDTFGDGPPIFELEDDEAIRRMLQAIAAGVAMVDHIED